MNVSRTSAIVLVVLLVASPVAASISLIGTASAAPDGFVGVPDSNVQTDLPSGADVSITEADLEGSVMASRHASTTDVILTTPDRAQTYVDGSNRVGSGSGGVALVIRDDSAHEGRQVALPADAIRQAVGHLPNVVYGVHEGGETWTRDVTARSGLLIFEVPEFSTNSVTFSGDVSISGTFTDGSSTSYQLNSLDTASDPQISLSGVSNSETETMPIGGNPRSVSVEVAGNLDPTNTQISLSGSRRMDNASFNGGSYDGTKGLSQSTPVVHEIDAPSIHSISTKITKGQEGETAVVRVVGDGSVLWSKTEFVAGTATPTWTPDLDVSNYSSVEVQYLKNGSNYLAVWNSWVESKGPQAVSVVSGDDSTTLSPGAGSDSAPIDLSLGDNSLSIDWTTGNISSGSIQVTERTIPSDITVSLNGESVSYAGSLAAGESVSRTLNADALQSGPNTLTVSLDSVSSDAPAPQVQLDYSHEASSRVSTTYSSDGWTESYNVSHTFGSTTSNATLTVPFARTVTEIRTAEISVDGGAWNSIPTDSYALNGTTLTVQLDDGDGDGDVDAGTTIAVRTTASRVKAVNGKISVTEPTTPDDNGLDTEFRIDERSPGFHVAVGSTRLGSRTHYTYQESWDNANEMAVVASGGEQNLYFPNAQAGATARVTTIPLEAEPEAGDVGIHVSDPDTPTVAVSAGKSGSGSDVTYRWLSTTAGKSYGLYSVSRGRYLDKTDAGATGVELVDDDSGETFRIDDLSDGSVQDAVNSTVGSVGTWGRSAASNGLGGLQEIAIVGAWAALVVLLVYATGNSSLRGRQRWVLVGSLTIGSGLLSLEVLRPGVVSSALSSGLADVIPLAGLAAVAIVGYSVVSWWQSRKTEAGTPETTVSFNLRDNK